MSPGPSVYIITYENHHQIIASGASHAGLEGRSRGALLMQDAVNLSLCDTEGEASRALGAASSSATAALSGHHGHGDPSSLQ